MPSRPLLLLLAVALALWAAPGAAVAAGQAEAAGQTEGGAPAAQGGAADAAPGDRPGDRRRPMPEEFKGVGVEERLGEVVTGSLPFTDSDGRAVRLGDYFRGDLPVVLTFVYHDCPMLCSLVLNGVTDVMSQANMTVGRDYRVLAVSIDPRDTPAQAAGAREVYGRRLGQDAGDGYAFLTGTPEAIAQLTEEVGFRYRWVEAQQEFAHTAMLAFISPEAEITRYLYGIQFQPSDFALAVREARAGTVGTTMDQLFLYCFVYDPAAGGYVVQATNVMKLGGLLTLLLLGGGLLVFWRRERHKNARARREGAAVWGDYEGGVSPVPHP